jgi:hypothetical protein
MKSRALIGLLVVGLVVGFVVVPASPAYAWSHGHGRVFIGVGPGFWWGPPYPYYWYPPPYYPPVVVQPQPQVYVQQAPAPPSAPPGEWYYCQSAGGYYPQVQSCPEPWVRVPPRNP